MTEHHAPESPSIRRYTHAADMLKVLGHPVRLTIIEHLIQHGAMTVSQLGDRLQIPQSTLSQHLNKMRARGLVGNRRQGVKMMYFITQPQLPQLLHCIKGCCVNED